jgi:TolA-binding protein
MVGNQFGSLYDGGDQQIDPQPFYSIAEAKRKQGKYPEAVAEIRKQLEAFPNDFKGWMLLAETQAENMGDLAGAQETVERVLTQEGHTPKNITFALNRAADWQIRFGQDLEAARLCLERVTTLFPDTEFAQLAAQRIAHLATPESLAEKNQRPRIVLQHIEEKLGLQENTDARQPKAEDPAKAAQRLVDHLNQFPLDNEAREKLALIYADHYGRLDMATNELEQLIQNPNQPQKHVVRLLNLLADIQVRLGGGPELAKQTLDRIIQAYPESAAAENARHRLAYLKMEMRSHEKAQAIKLGSYQKNIGLQ